MNRIKLKSGREIILRDLDEKDSPRKVQAYINKLISEDTFILINRKVTLTKEKEYIKSKITACRNGESICLIVDDSGKIGGIINADREAFKMRNNVVIGIALLPEYRGQGLGNYCMEILLRRVKAELRPKNIHLRAFATNKTGIRLYEKMGFRKIAKLPSWAKHRGKYVDEYIMLLK